MFEPLLLLLPEQATVPPMIAIEQSPNVVFVNDKIVPPEACTVTQSRTDRDVPACSQLCAAPKVRAINFCAFRSCIERSMRDAARRFVSAQCGARIDEYPIAPTALVTADSSCDRRNAVV
jgi:hypothetical protein